MEQTCFFSVVICGGILPSELRENHYLFRLTSSDVEYVSLNRFREQINELKQYILKNLDEVCRNFELVDSSVAFQKNKVPYKNLFKMLIAVGTVYGSMLRKEDGEQREQSFMNSYTICSVERLKLIEEFSDGRDLCELLLEAIWSWIDEKKITQIRAIAEVDVETLEAFKIHKAIIYDEEFYYFSEEMMKNICFQLSWVCSWPELKEQMASLNLIEKILQVIP